MNIWLSGFSTIATVELDEVVATQRTRLNETPNSDMQLALQHYLDVLLGNSEALGNKGTRWFFATATHYTITTRYT